MGAALFAANAVLYREQDYFAPAAEANPLLHTWSLSVEEQFYLLVPLMVAATVLLVSAKDSRRASALRAIEVLLWAVALTSLLLSVYLTDLGGAMPGIEQASLFSFYSPLTRAWEFSAGGLLAAHQLKGGAALSGKRIGVPIGLILVVGSMVLLDSESPFPGVRALPVVFGTLLLLAPGGRFSNASAPLAWPPFVRVGDLSYGWYLWHWPVIVLAKALGVTSTGALLALVLFALFVARITYVAVEQPFRRGRLSRVPIGRLLVACIAAPLVIALSVAALNTKAFEDLAAESAPPWSREDCHYGPNRAEEWPRDQCLRKAPTNPDGSEPQLILVLGDSHADALVDGVSTAAERLGMSLGVWTRDSSPAVGVGDWALQLRALVQQERPDVVIVANRSLAYLDDRRVNRWSEEIRPPGSARERQWGEAVQDSVSILQSQGAHVIWVHNVPEFHIAELGASSGPTLFRRSGRPLTLTLEQLEAQRAGIILFEERALEEINVLAIDPAGLFCGTECTNARGGLLLYRDAHHLTKLGSAFVGELLEEHIWELVHGVP
jgi:peptidoglycan/LPS O-acetylase OafA/YrhL